MSDPQPIAADLTKMMAVLRRLYQTVKNSERGFAPPYRYNDAIDRHREATNPDKIDDIRDAQLSRGWSQPTEEFRDWWMGHLNAFIKPTIAWNCESYRQEYLGSREIGAA